jgi:hypothetical protein
MEVKLIYQNSVQSEIYKHKKLSYTIFLCVFLVLDFSYAQQVNSDTKLNDNSPIMNSKIDTLVDSSFLYDYKATKYVPPDGKTLLIMGQTIEAINEYTEAFPNEKVPGGWAAYFGVTEFK